MAAAKIRRDVVAANMLTEAAVRLMVEFLVVVAERRRLGEFW
jgi:hypothetical protein